LSTKVQHVFFLNILYVLCFMLNRWLWCHFCHFDYQNIEKLCYPRRRRRLIRTEWPHSLVLPRGDTHVKLRQNNGDTLGVNNLLFRHYSGIIHVSLSSKTIQSNTQNLLPFTLMVRKQLTFIEKYFGSCKCVVTGDRPMFS
jgi:hypothetical protein